MSSKKPLWSMNGGEYIMELYRQTKDGKLNITPHYSEPNWIHIRWTQDMALRFAVQFDALVHDIAQIGNLWEKLGKTREENAKLLTKSALETWDTYVNPPVPPDMDEAQYERIRNKEYDCMPLTPGEIEFLELYEEKMWAAMLLRLPRGGIHPIRLHNECRIIARMYCQKCSHSQILEEIHILARYFILYYWTRPEDNFY